MKRIIIIGALVAWTIICIYGTYMSTIKSAQPMAIEGGYEITYGNTGATHIYE